MYLNKYIFKSSNFSIHRRHHQEIIKKENAQNIMPNYNHICIVLGIESSSFISCIFLHYDEF